MSHSSTSYNTKIQYSEAEFKYLLAYYLNILFNQLSTGNRLRDVKYFVQGYYVYCVHLPFYYPEEYFSSGETVFPLSDTCGCSRGQTKCSCPLATEGTFVPERACHHALLPWLVIWIHWWLAWDPGMSNQCHFLRQFQFKYQEALFSLVMILEKYIFSILCGHALNLWEQRACENETDYREQSQ